MKSQNLLSWALVAAVCLQVFILNSCKDTFVEPLDTSFRLTAEDVTVTDVYLHVTATGKNADGTMRLTRNGQTILDTRAGYHFAIDTVVHDRLLYPKHTYTYKAYYLYNGFPVDSSAAYRVTTMDTTGSSFTWSIYTIGDYGSSLNDVAIINDTTIWAVGQIFEGDSISNAAKWNGKEWVLYKVSVRLQYIGSVFITDQDPLVSILAPTADDIWFTSRAGGVSRFSNGSWIMMMIAYGEGPGYTNKMFGTDSTDMYFAGSSGRLTHFNGARWDELSSGTTLTIQDIYGAKNEKTGAMEILAVAHSSTTLDRKILKISNSAVTSLSDSGISTLVSGIWFATGEMYYAVGDGIFSKRNPSQSGKWLKELGSYYSQNYKTAVRGNGVNDVVVACGGGDILHFNGFVWSKILDGSTYPESGSFASVAMRGNLVVAAGFNGLQGIVAIGRR